MSTNMRATTLWNLLPPDAQRESLTFVDEGFGSVVWLSGRDTVIHVPKTAAAASGLARSSAIVPFLQDILPGGVPQPRWRIAPTPELPFGAFASSYIPGVPLKAAPASASLAREVGATLAAIHAVDTDEVGMPRDLVPDRDAVAAQREAVMAVVLPWLRETQPLAFTNAIERWWEGFRRRQPAFRYAPCLVHGDFWYGNLLTDNSQERLVAVLDWEAVVLDDPAQDLATLLHSRAPFPALALDAYRDHGGVIDVETLTRRDLLWEYREFTGLAIAIQADDQDEIAESLAKLRAGPLGRSLDADVS
jgi:aminoglycoside phosphotransferase (APT) family kinase protein